MNFELIIFNSEALPRRYGKDIIPILNIGRVSEAARNKPAREYINGQLIQKPIPQGKHSTIQTELSTAINAAVKPQRIARAFSELWCTFGERSTVPDVSVFSWDRIPRDENGAIANAFDAAPDWTIEILSSDQSQTKVTKHILHCLRHKTQIGWLIDPDEQTVFVYLPEQQTQVFDQPEELPSYTFFCQ